MVNHTISCRLCRNPAVYRFSRRILAETRDCKYFECATCGGLQTEEPTWLHHSYSNLFHMVGVESAYRSIWAQALVHYCARTLGIRGKILDFGGGHGLLCRLLRDIGYDAYLHDLHSANLYAPGFAVESLSGFSVITAFEVFEHLADPALEASSLLQAAPDFMIVGTARFQGQGSDWDYLFPHHGQHVFFWSRAAHKWLACSHGYRLVTCGKTVTIYARPQNIRMVQRLLLSACEYGAKAMQLIIPLVARPGVQRDQDEIIAHIIRQAANGTYD